MRTAVFLFIALGWSGAVSHAAPGPKQDTKITQQQRDLSGPNEHASIEIKTNERGGFKQTTVSRPGRFGAQSTSWVKNPDGKIVRKIIEGKHEVSGRLESYFKSVGESSGAELTTKQRAELSHTAMHTSRDSTELVIGLGATPAPRYSTDRVALATKRDPRRWGARNYDIPLGWASGPYSGLASKFGTDYAEAVRKTDARVLSVSEAH